MRVRDPNLGRRSFVRYRCTVPRIVTIQDGVVNAKGLGAVEGATAGDAGVPA